MFDDHSLLGVFERNRPELMNFVKDRKELTPDIALGDGTGFGDEDEASSVWEDDWEVAQAFYVDQIPPFDVTITGVNETGAAAVFNIIGVEGLNEGYGISVDDMASEMQMTYVARAISRWRRAGSGSGASAVDAFPYTATREGGGVVIE